jgi:hypothetical protein
MKRAGNHPRQPSGISECVSSGLQVVARESTALHAAWRRGAGSSTQPTAMMASRLVEGLRGSGERR